MVFGFLGFGKLASALVEGMLEANCCAAGQILVINRHPENLADQAAKRGIKVAANPRVLAQQADAILLATKPADSLQLLRDVRQHLEGKLLISLVAGLNLETLQTAAGHRTRLIRAMPNTPSLIRQGATAYALGDHATLKDAEVAEHIFASVGLAFRVKEGSIDAVTGLSGSGPAYVFTFIEALADGGVMMGLPREIALQLAIQTVIGSAQMVRETQQHPALLREMVASPGGTTMAAIEALERHGLRYTVMAAVRASADRAHELGKS